MQKRIQGTKDSRREGCNYGRTPVGTPLNLEVHLLHKGEEKKKKKKWRGSGDGKPQ